MRDRCFRRLLDQRQGTWKNRAQFVGVAAVMMRRILVNHARDRAAVKRGGDVQHLSVSALDAVFGGIRAKLDGVFDDKQFVVSFVSNVLVAGFIVYLGDQLGVGGQLSTGVVVVLGVRIFGNVAAIRRHLFKA